MIFLSLIQLLFLFRGICGEAEPEPHFFSPPQPQPDYWREINNVEPKTFVISGSNDQKNEPNLPMIGSMLSSIASGFNADNNQTNSNIPEVVFQDHSYQEQSAQPDQGGQQQMDTIQKVYNLQPITRLIATSEVDPDKKSHIWRSPLPFIHPDDCPHHKASKKSKSSKKKSRKSRKSESKPKTTPKPNPIDNDDNPFSSFLSSVLSQTLSAPVFEPEPMKNEPKAPSSFLMSITHKTEPQVIDMPPPPPMFMALIRKRLEPQAEPEPELMPPFSPLLALLSKMRSSEQKSNPEVIKEKEASPDQDKEPINFNFNINFTINNHNYPQLEQPRPRIFRRELPLPFLFQK